MGLQMAYVKLAMIALFTDLNHIITFCQSIINES